MKLIDLKNNIEFNKLKEPALCIKNGGIVVFPTETVYGIGANAFDENAVSGIFKAKGRPSDNPLIVHISDYDMLNNLILNVNNIEKKLMEKFWPGALTIILPKKENLPNNVTCGLDTVGIRMPENKIALELIKMSGVPIAAPSANISGRPSGTQIEDIYDELKNKVDYMIDGDISNIGLESTVVKVIDNEVVILRPGKISPEDIQNIGVNVKLDEHIFSSVKNNEKVESPGMKHRHYAPNTKTLLIDGMDNEKIKTKVEEIMLENKDKKIAIMSYEENKELFSSLNVKFISLGKIQDLDTVSKNVFKSLRQLDKLNIDICIIQGLKRKGLGIAIMNRMIRACEHNVITV